MPHWRQTTRTRIEEEEIVSKGERMERVGRLVCGVIALSSLLAGCGEDRPETAQDTFKAYLRNVYLNKDEEAFKLVAPEDRARLITLQDELGAAGAQKKLAEHETLLVRAIVNPYALRSVEMEEEKEGGEPGVTTLRYTLVDGQKGEARMVRGGSDQQWYLKVLP